jgi:ParB-like chromosome segregation protein Spo0J
MKKIELIEIKLDGSVTILPHPKQAELYGEEKIDNDFVESIKLHGVKQKPLIAPASEIYDEPVPKGAICIISGHRRFKASELAELPSVLCELRHYDSYFESEVDHILFNKTREKKHFQKAAEMKAYKQKLDQIRKDLENNGVEALDKYKSMNLRKHLQIDEKGRHYLPFARQLIADELKIKEGLQTRYDTIFDDDWVQDKLDLIFHSKLNKKEKKRLTELFSKHVDDGREEVDKEDGLSINKVYKELVRAWNQIDGIINPKPKVKKPKKKSTTKVWVKVKDFASKVDVIPQGSSIVDTDEDGFFYLFGNENNKHQHKIDYAMFLKYLKEQL